jgi:hypothetical protein
MPKSIETLLSPLSADEKQKGAIISLVIFVMEIDKSIAKEEVDYLETILCKYQFGDNMTFAKFVSSAKLMVQETHQNESSQDLFILNCSKNIFEKSYKKEVLTLIKKMSDSNKKILPQETKAIEKIRKQLSVL